MNTIENTESTQSPESFAKSQAAKATERHASTTARLDEVSATAAKTAAEVREARIALDALLGEARPISTESPFGRFLATANDFLDKAIYITKPVAAVVAVVGGAAYGGRAVYRKVTAPKAAPAVLPATPATPEVTL